ncbi:MAG: hypothetical protein JJ992_18475, partial [Planctomycetes bacterium]|nr:hypothetical protein [Planctomycetota bacterium]
VYLLGLSERENGPQNGGIWQRKRASCPPGNRPKTICHGHRAELPRLSITCDPEDRLQVTREQIVSLVFSWWRFVLPITEKWI